LVRRTLSFSGSMPLYHEMKLQKRPTEPSPLFQRGARGGMWLNLRHIPLNPMLFT
jgi:hypothetical protein